MPRYTTDQLNNRINDLEKRLERLEDPHSWITRAKNKLTTDAKDFVYTVRKIRLQSPVKVKS
jgi:hypothetical protein